MKELRFNYKFIWTKETAIVINASLLSEVTLIRIQRLNVLKTV